MAKKTKPSQQRPTADTKKTPVPTKMPAKSAKGPMSTPDNAIVKKSGKIIASSSPKKTVPPPPSKKGGKPVSKAPPPLKAPEKGAKGEKAPKGGVASKAPEKRLSAPPPRPVRRQPQPPPEPPKQKSFEERSQLINERLAKLDPEFVRNVREHIDLSWIYHDSALEGTVYTPEELRTAIDPNAANVDSSMQPICEEIRRHLQGLNVVRELAKNPKTPITVDLVREIYAILHPEEGDAKAVKYRKDIPQHRLYFHEYAAPDKIPGKLRAVLDWVNDPEAQKSRTPLRLATRAHYDLLRVFPFANDSGKVARLFLNLLLLKHGLPPAIIHSTERQRYYDALKGSSAAMNTIVQEAIDNQLASLERLLEQVAQRVPVHTP